MGGVGGFVVGSQFSSDQSWANGGSCPFSPQTTDTRTVHIYMHTALGSILLACVFRAHSLRESGCGDVSATAPRFVGFGLRGEVTSGARGRLVHTVYPSLVKGTDQLSVNAACVPLSPTPPFPIHLGRTPRG